MSFWGVILTFVGLVLLGLGFVAAVDFFAAPKQFDQTKTWRDLLYALLLGVGGVALTTYGVGRLFPKSDFARAVAWETPTERGVAYSVA